MSFVGELKRRNVVKVAVAYAIVGWLLIEVSSTVFPTFEAPAWVLQSITFVIILGFPLALVLSWVFDLTPRGLERTELGISSEGTAAAPRRKLDFVIVGLLVAGIAFLVADNYVLEGASEAPPEITVDESAEVAPATVAEELDVLPNSVAVLPFDNLSPNADDAFFSSGLHDEILNQLAKLRSLSVISRTSVLRYADSGLSIPEIASELNVETVMEGSVRYANDRVRITLQLIDAKTDEHLWSETYEREFADIFAIESDIAMNVANALEAEFSVEEQEAIERAPTGSTVAYALYLKATNAWFSGQTWESEMDQALAIDPDFALAHAMKAYLLAFGTDTWPVALERRVLESSARALELDPTLGLAHAALAYLHQARWRLVETEQSFERALELSPSDPVILSAYGRFHRNRGDYAEGVRLGRESVILDPSNTSHRYQLGVTLRYARDYEAAYEIFQSALALNQTAANTHMQLAATDIPRGNLDEALKNIRLSEELYQGELSWRYVQFAYIYSQLDRPDDVHRLFETLKELDQETSVSNAVWAMAYLAQGDYDEAVIRLQAAIDEQVPNVFTLAEIKANPYQDPELDEPRFVGLRERIGTF